MNVVLIGVGNLGYVLLNFNFYKNSNVCILVVFDVNEVIVNIV